MKHTTEPNATQPSIACLASLGHITDAYLATAYAFAQMPSIHYYPAKLFLIAKRHFRYPPAVI